MNKSKILENAEKKLGISQLNAMQRQVLACTCDSTRDLVIYAHTGSGKTLAFAVPILESVDANLCSLQAVVLVPSRELAIQVFSVLHALSHEAKVTVCYGGHTVEDERRSLAVTPAVVVATPGRLLDHARRRHIDLSTVRHLVIDEFDKCLELGFSDEMQHLFKAMPHLCRRILTSATAIEAMPGYVRLNEPIILDFTDLTVAPQSRMTVHAVMAHDKDKLFTLYHLLQAVGSGLTIVFLNHREAAERVFAFLKGKDVSCGIYHGGMQQIEREMAVAMFRNGTHTVLVATDLASRGLDIDGVKHIIHYNLPLTQSIYTHRNGRTARVSADGSVYVILGPDERCPDFITTDKDLHIGAPQHLMPLKSQVVTLHFAAGRKEKISRADIVGFLVASGGLEASQIGHIHLSDHYALVAVPRNGCHKLLEALNSARIKGRRVRITLAGGKA